MLVLAGSKAVYHAAAGLEKKRNRMSTIRVLVLQQSGAQLQHKLDTRLQHMLFLCIDLVHDS